MCAPGLSGTGQAKGWTDLPLITSIDMLCHAGRRVRMRGLPISYKRIPTKTGAWMKFLSLEDLAGTFEAVLFPDAYSRFAEATLGPGPLLIEGRVEVDHGVPSLTVDRLEPLGDAPAGAAPSPAAAPAPRRGCASPARGV
jgi:DNA polymerase III alpha subunit